MEDRSPSHVCLGMLATSLQKHWYFIPTKDLKVKTLGANEAMYTMINWQGHATRSLSFNRV